MHQNNIKKYTECLNDLMDYFIVADIQNISAFQRANALPNNLMMALTTTELGDSACLQGVIAPICGISNFPYTIYFNHSKTSVFSSSMNSDIQHQQDGYIVQVISQRLHLLTMPLLQNWSKHLDIMTSRPHMDIENGWYRLSVVCGETQQPTGWEPTIEFLLEKELNEPAFTADIHYTFEVDSRNY